MKYDFDTLPNRWNSNAEKYLAMKKWYELKQDTNIIPFSVADMDFVYPPELIEGLKEYISNNILGYTIIDESYYESIIRWIKRRHNIEIDRKCIVDTDNVIDGIRKMIQIYTQKDDEIITLSPVYPAFLGSIKGLGRQLYESELVLQNGKYTINFEELESRCRNKSVSMMIFCNPHNPIGKVWSKEELIHVADICLRNNVFIVSDEIHWDIIMPGKQFSSMVSLDKEYTQNCAVISSATKTFNIAGLKGGFILMPNDDKREMYIKYITDIGVSGRDIISYITAEIAYERCEGWLDELLVVINSNSKLIREYIHKYKLPISCTPLEGTYLQWLDFREIETGELSQEEFINREFSCMFTSGYKFGKGGDGFQRWNVACPQYVLTEALERIKDRIK